jgi:hypothetical protein
MTFPDNSFIFSPPSDDSSSYLGSPVMTPTSTASDSTQSDIIKDLISDLTDRISKVAVREEAVAKKEQDINAFDSLSAIEKLKLAFHEIDASNAAQAIEAYDEFNLKLLQKYGNLPAQKAKAGSFKLARDPHNTPYPQKFQLVHFNSEEAGPSRTPTWTESFGRTSASSSSTCTLPSPPSRTWPDDGVLIGPKSKGKAPMRDSPISFTRIATTFPKKEKPAKLSQVEISRAESKSDVVDLTTSNSPQEEDLDTATSSKSSNGFKVPDIDGNDASVKAETTVTEPRKDIIQDGIDITKNSAEPTHDNDKTSQKQEPATTQSILKVANKLLTSHSTTPSLAEEWDSEVEQLEHDFHTGVRGFVRDDGSTLRLINGIPSIVSTDADSAPPSAPGEPTISSKTDTSKSMKYDAASELQPQLGSTMAATKRFPHYPEYPTNVVPALPSGESALAPHSYTENLYPNPLSAPYSSGTACSIRYPFQTPAWYSQGPYRGYTTPVGEAWYNHFTPMSCGPLPPNCICNGPPPPMEEFRDNHVWCWDPIPAQQAQSQPQDASNTPGDLDDTTVKVASGRSENAEQSNKKVSGGSYQNSWVPTSAAARNISFGQPSIITSHGGPSSTKPALSTTGGPIACFSAFANSDSLFKASSPEDSGDHSFGNSPSWTAGGPLFGGTASTAPNTAVLWGNSMPSAPKTGGNLWTNPVSTTANAGGSLFGGNGVLPKNTACGASSFDASQIVLPQARPSIFPPLSTSSTPKPFSSSDGLFGAGTNSSRSIFDSAPPASSSGNLFGGESVPEAARTPGLFGNNNNESAPRTGVGLFGQNHHTGAPGLFGNSNNASAPRTGVGLFEQNHHTGAPGLFGNTNNASAPHASGGLFGPRPGLFGNHNNTSTPRAGGGPFGQSQCPAGTIGTNTSTNLNTGSGPFGSTQCQQSAKPTFSLFGSSSSSSNTGGGLFGKTPATESAKMAPMNGTSTITSHSAATNIFGEPQSIKVAQPSGGLFANNTSTSPYASGGLFGPTQQPSTQQNSSTFTWGPSFTNGGGLFGNQPANKITTSGDGLFRSNAQPDCVTASKPPGNGFGKLDFRGG